MEDTKEYRETHYSDNHKKIKIICAPESIFLRDYLQNLIEPEVKPFVSPSFTYLGKAILYFGLSVLDLPLSIDTFEKYPHKIESDGNRGIVITAGAEAIVFKREMKEGLYNLKNDMVIKHKYWS